jgi:hypothetical protein
LAVPALPAPLLSPASCKKKIAYHIFFNGRCSEKKKQRLLKLAVPALPAPLLSPASCEKQKTAFFKSNRPSDPSFSVVDDFVSFY